MYDTLKKITRDVIIGEILTTSTGVAELHETLKVEVIYF